MDTSQANIKYLIKDNSGVVIPNQSYNSLYDTQNTFISNNFLSISNTQKPNQLATQPKKIIRGGYRLEPILYNQLYTTSSNSWAGEISLYDNYISGSVVNDWTAKIGMNVTSTEPHDYEELTPPYLTWTTLNHLNYTSRVGSAASLNNLITTTPDQTSTYKVTDDIKSDAVDLIFTLHIFTSCGDLPSGYSAAIPKFRIFNKTQGTQLGHSMSVYTPENSTGENTVSNILLSSNMVNGHEYEVQVMADFHNNQYVESPSYFEISQLPIPTSNIPTTSLWVSSSYPAYPINSIYTSNPSLVSLFNAPNVKQLYMPTSSFPEITEDWYVKPGDEFRYDGQESHVFMVKEAYVSGSDLVVIMNQPIPPYPAVDINHFLIRRYVPDASQVIFDGSISPLLVQPYLLKPQYVTENLNKNLQTIITTLIKDGVIM